MIREIRGAGLTWCTVIWPYAPPGSEPAVGSSKTVQLSMSSRAAPRRRPGPVAAAVHTPVSTTASLERRASNTCPTCTRCTAGVARGLGSDPPPKHRDQSQLRPAREALPRRRWKREVGDLGWTSCAPPALGGPRVATHHVPVMNESASYLAWGWLSISAPNLIVILVMVLLFALAIVLPFPKDRDNR